MQTIGVGVRTLLFGSIAWLLVATVLTLQFWPDLPRSMLQWALLVAFGPPAYFLGEAFFSWLFSLRHGQSISPRTFSIKRVMLLLPVVLAFTCSELVDFIAARSWGRLIALDNR